VIIDIDAGTETGPQKKENGKLLFHVSSPFFGRPRGRNFDYHGHVSAV